MSHSRGISVKGFVLTQPVRPGRGGGKTSTLNYFNTDSLSDFLRLDVNEFAIGVSIRQRPTPIAK